MNQAKPTKAKLIGKRFFMESIASFVGFQDLENISCSNKRVAYIRETSCEVTRNLANKHTLFAEVLPQIFPGLKRHLNLAGAVKAISSNAEPTIEATVAAYKSIIERASQISSDLTNTDALFSQAVRGNIEHNKYGYD